MLRLRLVLGCSLTTRTRKVRCCACCWRTEVALRAPRVIVPLYATAAGLCRQGSFRTPLTGPLVPKSTVVEQSQEFHRYAGDVYVWQSSNRAMDVPYSDYFTAEHKFTVSPGHTPGTCKLLITNEVKFSKSTWFESKITSGSNDGATQSYQFWLRIALEYLQQQQTQQQGTVSTSTSPLKCVCVRVCVCVMCRHGCSCYCYMCRLTDGGDTGASGSGMPTSIAESFQGDDALFTPLPRDFWKSTRAKVRPLPLLSFQEFFSIILCLLSVVWCCAVRVCRSGVTVTAVAVLC